MSIELGGRNPICNGPFLIFRQWQHATLLRCYDMKVNQNTYYRLNDLFSFQRLCGLLLKDSLNRNDDDLSIANSYQKSSEPDRFRSVIRNRINSFNNIGLLTRIHFDDYMKLKRFNLTSTIQIIIHNPVHRAMLKM